MIIFRKEFILMMNYNQEIENDRLSKLKDLEKDNDLYEDILKDFGPNSVGNHELLDRVSIIQHNIYDFLLEHPTCIMNRKLYHLTYNVYDLLETLYEKIGGLSVAETSTE